MKQKNISTEGFESTYSLLVRSEEKERGMFEGAVYLVIVLSAVFSIWQVAQEPVALPTSGVIRTASFVQCTDTQQQGC